MRKEELKSGTAKYLELTRYLKLRQISFNSKHRWTESKSTVRLYLNNRIESVFCNNLQNYYAFFTIIIYDIQNNWYKNRKNCLILYRQENSKNPLNVAFARLGSG